MVLKSRTPGKPRGAVTWIFTAVGLFLVHRAIRWDLGFLVFGALLVVGGTAW